MFEDRSGSRCFRVVYGLQLAELNGEPPVSRMLITD